MELVRIHTYQMASQKPFLLSNLYPGLCDNNHFSSLWSKRTLLPSASRTFRQSVVLQHQSIRSGADRRAVYRINVHHNHLHLTNVFIPFRKNFGVFFTERVESGPRAWCDVGILQVYFSWSWNICWRCNESIIQRNDGHFILSLCLTGDVVPWSPHHLGNFFMISKGAYFYVLRYRTVP